MTIKTKRLTKAEGDALWPELKDVNHLHSPTKLLAYRAEHDGNSQDCFGNVVLVEDGDGWLMIFDRVYSL